MIETFQAQGPQTFVRTGDRSGVRADMADKIENILTLLDEAKSVDVLNAPSLHLHQLKGDLKGFWSVSVRANWRIIFRFRGGSALDVELIDYH